MELLQKYKKGLIPVAILVIAFAIFSILKATKPEVPLKEVQERFWPVAVSEVTFKDIRPFVRAYGEIRAGREAELRAQVSGNVIAVHPDLGDGASVRAGDILVEIDDFDYVATLKERTADLNEARAKLEELTTVLEGEEKLLPVDQRQVSLARNEVARQKKLLKSSAGRKKTYDDAQASLNDRLQKVLIREQSIARQKSQIIQAQSALEKAQTALLKAERDVADTKLKAPFDGFLTETNVTAGKQVSTSDRLGRLISLERLEVSFHLSEADYLRLAKGRDLVDRVINVKTNDQLIQGRINRIDARVDAKTGGRNVFATLSGLELTTDLRPGLFVEVSVPDRLYSNVVALPKQALHDNSFVYIVENERLKKRSVSIAASNGDQVLISDGLKAGEKVNITRFAELGEGIKVVIK